MLRFREMLLILRKGGIGLIIAVLLLAPRTSDGAIQGIAFNSLGQFDRDVKAQIDNLSSSAGGFNDLKDSLSIGIVGRLDRHTITFTITDSLIQLNGAVVFTYPDGFDLSNLDSVAYLDSDTLNTDPLIAGTEVAIGSVRIDFDSTGTPPDTGSQISFVLDSIVSPTVSGGYWVVVSVLDSNGALVAGPTLTPTFELLPDSLDSIAVSPHEPDTIVVGNSIAFSCERWDKYGNALSEPEPVWSIKGVPDPLNPNGSISASGLFKALRVGQSKIYCDVDSLTDSVTVEVTNSAFDHFTVGGFPDSTTAGVPFSSAIVVEMRDIYGNLVPEYGGDIWFVCTDPAASISPNSQSPYTVTDSDTASVTFPGSNFTFRTAGLQHVYLTDGNTTSNVFAILVKAGVAAQFTLTAPSDVVAGAPFDLSVDNVEDSVGNVLDAFVTVELVSAGVSPGGDKPVVNSFLAANGSGSGTQTLVSAEVTQFRVTIGSVEKFTGDITVTPAAASEFIVDISSPQIVGIPFDSTAEITVQDELGNLVVDFDASEDNVTLTPDGNGVVVPSKLVDQTSFQNGVCDLTRFATRYEGQARFLTFTAQSSSGVSGTSETIEVNSSSIEGLSVTPSQLSAGDTLIASVIIANFGSLPADMDKISLNSSQGDVIRISEEPPLPHSIAGNSSSTFQITTKIPDTFNPGWTRFRVSFHGLYNLQPIVDTSEYLDSTLILVKEGLLYADSTLAPVVVTKGASYAFTCGVNLFGTENITLNTNTVLRFTSLESDTFVSHLAIPIYVIAPSSQPVTLFFADETIPADFASGAYGVKVRLEGQRGSAVYIDSLKPQDSIFVQTAASLEFDPESFKPSTAFRGTSISPTLTINNRGEAVLALDMEKSVLRLTSGDDEIRFSLSESDSTITPDSNLLHFESKVIPSSFSLESNSLTLDLSGVENGHAKSVSLSLGENLIEFLQQATVQITSVKAIAPNVPNVNTGQDFPIVVDVTNKAEEDLSDVWIGMHSDGISAVSDSLLLDTLRVGETDSLIFDVTASSESNPAELFTASIESAKGVMTGHDAIIMAPLDNTAVVNIQTPAELWLSARIDAPPTAVDGTLSYGQGFHTTARFENYGQSSVGSGVVGLSFRNAPGFVTDDDTLVEFAIDDMVGWNVVTPRTDGNFEIIVEFDSIPTDSNTGLPALLRTDADSIAVSVRQEELKLQAAFESYAGHLLSPGEQFMPMTLNFSAIAENPESEIRLDEVVINLVDRDGASIAADNLLEGAGAQAGLSHVDAELTGNQVRFMFGNNVIVGPDQAMDVPISFTLSSEFAGTNFFLEMDSSSITATDFTFGIEGAHVPTIGPGNNNFTAKFGYGMVERNLESSFFNYPNPFAAGLESTNIVYYLTEASDVTLEIFTLIGEKVFSEEISSGSPGASSGRNVVIWDGSNSRGNTVRNGVYIAVLKAASGGEARTKIAVVK